jgi:hypothetical protein
MNRKKCFTLLAIIIVLTMLSIPAIAQDKPAAPAEPEWTDMGYGRYQTIGNFMVWEMAVPVMTDRFSKYGNAELDRNRNIVVNTTTETKAKDDARALRTKLLSLIDEKGIFELNSATLQFQNQIRIERKGDTSWEILNDKILPLFNETYGPKAAE